MPNTSDAGQPELYIELLQLFEQARQLQTQSTQLLALARQDAGDVQAVPADPEAHTAPDAPRSLEETLDSIITLLAACSFENQVTIIKTLALGMASAARARADVKHPPTA
jgi:signal transduction histidine kinase